MLEDAVLVIHTPMVPSAARELLKKLHSVTDLPVRYVVNTHWHPDHTQGNEVGDEASRSPSVLLRLESAQALLDATFPAPYVGATILTAQRGFFSTALLPDAPLIPTSAATDLLSEISALYLLA